MSAALSHAGIDRQSIEELSFAEMAEQCVELLPSRTVLSMLKSGLGDFTTPVGAGPIPNFSIPIP